MKIKSYKKIKNNCYHISFQGNVEDIVLFDDVILKYNLLLKKEISEQELQEILKENFSLGCYYKALQYISKKNVCKKEIRDYLKKNHFSNAMIESTISLLEEKKIIDEEKYLEAFIHDQICLTTNGPKKIMKKLVDLEFLEDLINKYLNEVSREVWIKRLENLISKKVKANHRDGEQKVKEKILYYCKNEGYKKEDILAVFEKIEFPKNDDALEREAIKLYTKYSRKYEGNELFYQIKGRLINKGFSYSDVDCVIEKLNQLRKE